MNLETPKKFRGLVNQAHQVAENYFRPISRKYDKAEHAYPKELDLLAALLDGMNAGSPDAIGATSASKRGAAREQQEGIKNGGNLSALLGVPCHCRQLDVEEILTEDVEGPRLAPRAAEA